MKHYAGLDVSVKETAVCIVDEGGRICREMKVASHPDDLVEALKNPAWNLARIGLEAAPLSQWLFSGLAGAGLPASASKPVMRRPFSRRRPVVALAFKATVDIPAHFKNAKAVGRLLG